MTITVKNGKTRAERKRINRIKALEAKNHQLLVDMVNGSSYSKLGAEYEANKEEIKRLKNS